MEIQPSQVVFLMIHLFTVFVAYKTFKKKMFKTFGLILLLSIIMVLFNPVRFKQEGGAKLERSIHRFDIPEKVLVIKPSFEEKQATDMAKLKSQSKEMKNEIHD